MLPLTYGTRCCGCGAPLALGYTGEEAREWIGVLTGSVICPTAPSHRHAP